MGKAIRASVLVLLLACSANAGIMQMDAAPPPPPPQLDGIIQYGVVQPSSPQSDGIMQNDAAPLLVQIALNLLTLL